MLGDFYEGTFLARIALLIPTSETRCSGFRVFEVTAKFHGRDVSIFSNELLKITSSPLIDLSQFVKFVTFARKIHIDGK